VNKNKEIDWTKKMCSWACNEKFKVDAELKEYHDTGLTPEEIKEHEEMFTAYRHVCGGKSPEEIEDQERVLTAYRHIFDGREPEEIQQALDLQDAEKQGRIIDLPCKIGDSVFDTDLGRPTPYMIIGFSSGKIGEDYDLPDTDEIYFHASCSIAEQSFPLSEIGKTIFLTKEDAKDALKRNLTKLERSAVDDCLENLQSVSKED
jgi:hypothetical protein